MGRFSIFFIAMLTFLSHIPFWSRPFEMDEGFYAYGGWQMLKGLVMYRDLYDFKPPGIYFLNALTFYLTSPDAVNVYVCAAFFSVGTALGVYFAGKSLWGKNVGLLGAFLFAVFSTNPQVQGGCVNAEVFMILPFIWAFYFIIKGMSSNSRIYYFIGGSLISMATLFKQVAGIELLIGLVAIYWKARQRDVSLRKSMYCAIIFLAGFVMPWFFFAGYFLYKGAFKDFFFWLFEFPVHYILLNKTTDSQTGVMYRELWLWITKGSVILWFLSFAAIIVMLKRREIKEKLLVLLFFYSLFAVSLGLWFPHYFIQLLPLLSLLAAGGIMILYGYFRKKWLRISKYIIIGLLLMTCAEYVGNNYKFYLQYSGDDISVQEYRRFFGDFPIFGVARKVGLALKDITKPEDTIYVWAAEPQINFYAQRRTPARTPVFVWGLFKMLNEDQVLMEDLNRNKPDYVVVFEPLSRSIRFYAFLKEHYVGLYGIKGLNAPYGQGIYKRKPEALNPKH